MHHIRETQKMLLEEDEFVNNNVCRTAPAELDLLNTLQWKQLVDIILKTLNTPLTILLIKQKTSVISWETGKLFYSSIFCTIKWEQPKKSHVSIPDIAIKSVFFQ